MLVREGVGGKWTAWWWLKLWWWWLPPSVLEGLLLLEKEAEGVEEGEERLRMGLGGTI
jgi:hypothetical protein